MNIYCSSCGSKNEWSGVKPMKCEYCKEPFAKKIVRAEVVKPKIQSQEEVRVRRAYDSESDDDDFDIPTSFQMDTDARPKSRNRKTVFDTYETMMANTPEAGGFQRENLPPELSKVKQEVLKHMLPNGDKNNA